MKKILLISVFILIALNSICQIYQEPSPGMYGIIYQRMDPRYVLHIPHLTDTASLHTNNDSVSQIGEYNGQIYINLGTPNYWKPISTGDISLSWGNITGTLSNQTDLQNALNLKLNIADTTAKWVDWIYRNADSVFYIKNGVPIFAYKDSTGSVTTWGSITGTLNNQTDLQTALNLKFNTADFNSTFDTRFATKTTTNLTEGTNLYYTNARARAAISLTTTGSGAATYDNATGVFNIPTPTHPVPDLQAVLDEGNVANDYLRIQTSSTFWTELTDGSINIRTGNNPIGLDARDVVVGNCTVSLPDIGDLLGVSAQATLLSSVSLNGGAPIFAGTNGNVDLTVTTSYTETDPIVKAINGIVKSNGTTISAATAGTDYLAPFGSQTANYFYAAPNGSAGTAVFRAIVSADIPTLNQNTTGSAATLTTARNIQGIAFNGSANIDIINGTGFVKATGTNITYDNSTYLTTASAASTYQPLDADLTIYAGITPSANVQTLLGSSDFAAFRTNLGLGTSATHASTDYLLAANNLSDVNAATARINLGATTVGENLLLLPNPSAIKFIKINADNSVATRTQAQLKVDLSLDLVDNTSDATKNSATATLTNKAITKRVTSITTSAAPAPSASTDDGYKITALGANATFASPGTGTAMQELVIRIKDDGSSRALTWNAIYRGSTDLPLPATTVISKTMYLKFIYNSDDSKWDLVAFINNF